MAAKNGWGSYPTAERPSKRAASGAVPQPAKGSRTHIVVVRVTRSRDARTSSGEKPAIKLNQRWTGCNRVVVFVGKRERGIVREDRASRRVRLVCDAIAQKGQKRWPSSAASLPSFAQGYSPGDRLPAVGADLPDGRCVEVAAVEDNGVGLAEASDFPTALLFRSADSRMRSLPLHVPCQRLALVLGHGPQPPCHLQPTHVPGP